MKKKALIICSCVLILVVIGIPVIMFNIDTNTVAPIQTPPEGVIPELFNIDANTISFIKVQRAGVAPGTTGTANIKNKSEINKIVKDINSLRYESKIDSGYLPPGWGDYAVKFYDRAGNELPCSFLRNTNAIYIYSEKIMYDTVPNSTINYNYFANLTGDAQI